VPSEPYRFRTAGDQGLFWELGDGIEPKVHLLVRGLFAALHDNPLDGIVEIIPAYRSLLVMYNPVTLDVDVLKHHLKDLFQRTRESPLIPPRVVKIPVAFGEEYGPDLPYVAEHNGITVEQVIELFCARDYLVYMVGFSPGFPFLGGLDERLHTPRLETPRTRVPKGSVAIANQQTGIYSVSSPGGWRLIGRTPIELYQPDHDPPALVKMGDAVRFHPISPSQDGEHVDEGV
jgi:KipI family sensor histidine kinase inhibitor